MLAFSSINILSGAVVSSRGSWGGGGGVVGPMWVKANPGNGPARILIKMSAVSTIWRFGGEICEPEFTVRRFGDLWTGVHNQEIWRSLDRCPQS